MTEQCELLLIFKSGTEHKVRLPTQVAFDFFRAYASPAETRFSNANESIYRTVAADLADVSFVSIGPYERAPLYPQPKGK